MCALRLPKHSQRTKRKLRRTRPRCKPLYAPRCACALDSTPPAQSQPCSLTCEVCHVSCAVFDWAAAVVAQVRDELHSECVLRYMRAIVDGLPQTVVHEEALASFRNFSCEYQRAEADRLRLHGVAEALDRFDAWFDADRGCALREEEER
jgi:hypothetical protein